MRAESLLQREMQHVSRRVRATNCGSPLRIDNRLDCFADANFSARALADVQPNVPFLLRVGDLELTAGSFDNSLIADLTEVGDRVILEYTWTGYPRTPVGTVRPGEAMRARICQVIEYEDGLIIRQRNYDCFEPF